MLFRSHRVQAHHDPAPLAELPRHYIEHTAPRMDSLALSAERARAAGWHMHEIATGHDAMLAEPDAMAALLDAIARG